MLTHGTMNALEGIRLVLAVVGIALSTCAAAFAHNGSMVFAAPIRRRMVLRRRAQMIGYLIIFLIIGGQTLDAASVPDPPVITSAGLAVSYVMIAVMGILIIMVLMFSIGWIGIETVVGTTPLQPERDTAVTQSSLEARDILHEINNDMTKAIGLIDLAIQTDVVMAQSVRIDLQVALALLGEVTRKQEAAHILVRSQTDTVMPPREIT